MAELLMKYYKHITDEMGIVGKIKLAVATKIPSTLAAITPDSPANIALFQTAIQTITGKPAPHIA